MSVDGAKGVDHLRVNADRGGDRASGPTLAERLGCRRRPLLSLVMARWCLSPLSGDLQRALDSEPKVLKGAGDLGSRLFFPDVSPGERPPWKHNSHLPCTAANFAAGARRPPRPLG